MEEFLSNLRKSKLLTPEQWMVVRREVADAQEAGPDGNALSKPQGEPKPPPSPHALAKRLVKLCFLTRWQADMLLQGKKDLVIEKYTLLDCIGTGGMGAVFKALHGEMGRIVAIKMLSPGVMKNSQAVRRFRHEIQAVAALDDPHIVAAYDAGTYGEIHYLVMEYVEGHDLGYLVRHQSPLPVLWVCECIRQAASGLQHAHEQGMVHRDIKPTNLLVAKDPDSAGPLVKILDLGLARFVTEMTPADLAGPGVRGEDGSLTQFGQFLGTPDYIAPEQALDTRAADIRSDIFSLGCTFFRLLTGELPFPGRTVLEKLEARESTNAWPVRKFRSDVPVEIEAVVARMLAREPRDRYQTPRQVAQALTPFTTPAPSGTQSARVAVPHWDEPAATPPLPRPPEEESRLELIFSSLAACETDQTLSTLAIATRLKRVSPRTWLVTAGLGASCLAAFMVWHCFSAATLVFDWPEGEREGAVLMIDRRQIKLPPQQKFFVSGRPGKWDIRLRREGFEPIEAAASLRHGEHVDFAPHWRPTPARFRQTQWQALERRTATAADADVLSAEAMQTRADLLSFLQKYPAGTETTAARKLVSRLFWPLDLLDESNVAADERQRFAISANGGSGALLVGVFGDSRLKFWNGMTAAAISGDGTLLAAASLDGTVQVYELQRGRLRHVLTPDTTPAELAFGSGSRLAIAGETGSVTLWNAAEGTLKATLPDTAGPIAFSHDGNLIAVRAARQEIALWDADTGELRRTLQGHSTGVLRGLTFSHNGRMLASFGSDSSVLLWDVASGQERRRFANAQAPLFSPEDAFLAAGAINGDLVLWDTRTGETQRTLDEGGRPLAFGAGLSDKAGKTIISKRLGRAILWNLETGDEIRTVVEVPELAAVSRDGKWLVGGDPSVGELRLWDLTANGGPKVVNTAGPVAVLACSSDSSTIVTGSRDGIVQIWAAETGLEVAPAGLPLTAADLSPDGRRLVVRQGERVDLIDVTTGRAERTLAAAVPELDSLSFSPDGRLVAGFGGWGFFRTSLRLWDSITGNELAWPENISETVRTTAFSADSQLLAVAGDSRLATVWNVPKRTVRYDLDDFTDRITALAFHPNGLRLAVASQDQKLVLWDLKKGSGQTLSSPGVVCRRLIFSHDGSLLAAATDERVLIWNLAAEKAPVELATGSVNTLAFHPAGDAIMAAGNEGCLRLWNDPAKRRFGDEPDQVIRVGPAQGVVKRVLWSPEGRHVLSINGNGTVYVLRVKNSRKR